MQKSCLKTSAWLIARQPLCWKWISVTKVSKYGKSECSRTLKASYTSVSGFGHFRNQSEHGSYLHLLIYVRFRIESSISLWRQVKTEQGELLQRRMGGKYFNFTCKAYLRQNGSVEFDRKRHQSFLVMCLIKTWPVAVKWVAWLSLARIWRALKFRVLKFESRSGLISTWCKSEAWNLAGGDLSGE